MTLKNLSACELIDLFNSQDDYCSETIKAMASKCDMLDELNSDGNDDMYHFVTYELMPKLEELAELENLPTLSGSTFYGNQISKYGIEHRRVDYETLSKAFDHILSNDLIHETTSKGMDWELVQGSYDVEEYQYYIVSDDGAEILKNWTRENLYYCEQIDLYVWAVSHFGTGWDYVLTTIKIETE